jgi:SAM-dependent methyltransferase
MKLSNEERDVIHAEVTREYNVSPLAVERGYVYIPGRNAMEEIDGCLRYLNPGSTLLDVGTGMAIVPRFIKKLGCRVVSIDNPLSGSDAAANAELAGIETLSCDIIQEPIPLPDASVDCINFGDVIEHLLHSPRPAIREFWRVLKPGGACIATTPNALRLSARLRLALGISNWPEIKEYYDEVYHGGHHHEYTPEEFQYVFTACGFEIEAFRLYGTVTKVAIPSMGDLQSKYRGNDRTTHPLIALAKMPIAALEHLVPRFRPRMLVAARKPSAAVRTTPVTVAA